MKLVTNTAVMLRNLSGSLLKLILEMAKFKKGEIRAQHDNRQTMKLKLEHIGNQDQGTIPCNHWRQKRCLALI